MEPSRVGGLGVLDPSLLLHDLRASIPVLVLHALLCQAASSMGFGSSLGRANADSGQHASVAMAQQPP